MATARVRRTSIIDIIAASLPEPALSEFRAGLDAIAATGRTMLGVRSVGLDEFVNEWFWSAPAIGTMAVRPDSSPDSGSEP